MDDDGKDCQKIDIHLKLVLIELKGNKKSCRF